MVDGATMRGAETAAAIAMRTLLENAVKITSQGSRIEICLTADAQNIALRIRDNGPSLNRGDEQCFF
ncbi:ATP-binding protein [Novosphingobium sp. ERN07]|uniref:ATP-binding protein n=1 Tax=Novosphingobium sp. ERN07 TaxID=2726187 RepID=UPI00351AF629